MRLVWGYAPDGTLVNIDADDVLDRMITRENFVATSCAADSPNGKWCCGLRKDHSGPWHIDPGDFTATLWGVWPS